MKNYSITAILATIGVIATLFFAIAAIATGNWPLAAVLVSVATTSTAILSLRE